MSDRKLAVLSVAQIAEQNAEDLDDRFDMTPLDSAALFVAFWQLLVEQDLPDKLQKAVDLVETAFKIV
jgi:hypothetical protein